MALSFAFDATKGETPASIARRRAMAEAMIPSRAPQNVGEGLNAIGQALMYRQMMGKADAAETEGLAGWNDAWAPIAASLGGGASSFPAAPSTDYASDRVAQAHGVPQGERADYIRTGLLNRGLPEHVADAFLMNFQDESGLDPGINEAAPIVPGSRGGYGLYQLTGPRRRAYETFAQERGVSPDDIDAQLDFLMLEGQGSEKSAFDKILAAPTTGEAATAIVNDFLRPAEEHRRSRVQRYMQAQPTQVASADPSIGLGQPYAPATTPEMDAVAAAVPAPDAGGAIERALVGNVGAQPGMVLDGYSAGAPAYSTPGGQRVMQTLMQQQPMGGGAQAMPLQGATPGVQQVAQALIPDGRLEMSGAVDIPQPSGPSLPQLMQAAGNPFMPESMRPILNTLISQEMQRSDPMRQIELDTAREKLNQLRNPVPEQTAEMQNLQWRAQQAGLQPGSPEYVEFMRTGGKVPETVVNVGGNTDKFVEESDKQAATRLNDIVVAGNSAAEFMGDLEALTGIATQLSTGKGAQVMRALGPYAQAVGIDIANLGEAEAYQAIVDRLAPQMRPPGSGAASDFDARQFLNSLPQLGNTPGGNEIIMGTLQALQQHRMAAAEIASQSFLPKDQGGITWQEAEKQIRALGNPYQAFNDYRQQVEGNGPPPAGIAPEEWQYMTPEERRLFQ